MERLAWRRLRDFSRGGIELQSSDGPGEVRRTAADLFGRSLSSACAADAINLVLTGHIPLYWDSGRALAGVTAIHDGYQVCMIALPYAHGNRTPFLSVNTCVHELLHALLQDVFVSRPRWYQAGGREFRIDLVRYPAVAIPRRHRSAEIGAGLSLSFTAGAAAPVILRATGQGKRPIPFQRGPNRKQLQHRLRLAPARAAG